MNIKNLINQKDLKEMTFRELEILAEEISSFLINSVSKTGGHIGANLGVVELTIALHAFFDIEKEPLIFDVGHQGYTHKILTGRIDDFSSLNSFGGMSRFITRDESKYDMLDASHAGTSIATASGIAYKNLMNGSNDAVVAIIGDGSMVEGMAFEGLNYVPENKLPLIIVINDNGMAIAPNVGGIQKLFSGDDWISKSRNWFEGLGYNYEPVEDGHNIEEIYKALEKSRKHLEKKPVVVHVKTEKGRGLELAKSHPYKLHFSMPFNPGSGAGISATPIGESFQAIVGSKLSEFMDRSENIYAITPATPYASGIEDLMKKFPMRAIDVGMAEQHAIGMSAGLCMNGANVFACFQSTFMQRAIDPIIHDICYSKIPITIVSARSGFSGYDGPTHHGIYDFGILRTLPNIKIFYAGTKRDLEDILEERYKEAKEPLIILHPYELISPSQNTYLPKKKTPIDSIEMICDGDDGIIISVGNQLDEAYLLQNMIYKNNNKNYSVYNLRWLNPLPKELKSILTKYNKIITLEESVRNGGIGSAINDFTNLHSINCDIHISAIDNIFLPAGDKDELSNLCGINAEHIYNDLKSFI